jgi:hypothetical protein
MPLTNIICTTFLVVGVASIISGIILRILFGYDDQVLLKQLTNQVELAAKVIEKIKKPS